HPHVGRPRRGAGDRRARHRRSAQHDRGDRAGRTPHMLVAVDAGSGSCRAAAFDDDGSLHALCAREWEHPPERGVPGGRRFDTERAWTLISECIHEVSAGVEVEAIATTSFRGGLVAFDRAGEVLWAVPNGDARAGEEARALIASGEAAA